MIRKFSGFFILVTGVTLITGGCASSLRHESDWPRIRTTAATEVANREGDSRWAHDAYFTPTEHTNGVWTIVVSAHYPIKRTGDSIHLRIKDEGEVVSYLRRFANYPVWIEHVRTSP